MSITTEITRLQNAKSSLKSSLEAKGVTVASDATLDAYPALVDSIPSGGDISVIKSTADWSQISANGVECAGLAELAAVTGIAEADLQEMFTLIVYSILVLNITDTFYAFQLAAFEIEDNKPFRYFWSCNEFPGNPEIIKDGESYYAYGWGSD